MSWQQDSDPVNNVKKIIIIKRLELELVKIHTFGAWPPKI